MPPTGTPEKTGASGPYFAVAPPPPRRLMTAAGYFGLVVLGLVTLVVIVRVVSAFSDGGAATAAPEGYEEVDLGQIARELVPESGGLVRETFMVKVVLVLNPKARDLPGLKAQVERRRNLFRDIVLSEIINPKSDADLRRPAMLETLKTEIRDRLNQELGGAKDDRDRISRVIFPERRLPERR